MVVILPQKDPLDVRDGSQERAAAVDGDEWRELPTQDGHLWQVPPEALPFLAPGTVWNIFQWQLKPFLDKRKADREGKKRSPREHSVQPTTATAAAALFAYGAEAATLSETMSASELARQLVAFAIDAEIEGADLLDAASSTLRDLAGQALRALRKARRRG